VETMTRRYSRPSVAGAIRTFIKLAVVAQGRRGANGTLRFERV